MEETPSQERAAKLLKFIDRSREIQGVTIVALCNRVGISSPTYFRWLRENCAPLAGAIAMADALGLQISISYIRGDGDEEANSTA